MTVDGAGKVGHHKAMAMPLHPRLSPEQVPPDAGGPPALARFS